MLGQQVEQWVDELLDAQPPAAPVEHTARLLCFTAVLLEQHRVDKRGRCRFCGWSRRGRRFWHRRPQCTVCRALAFAMAQALDVVWWQLFTSTNKKCSLVEVREWLTQRELQACPQNSTENNSVPPPE